MASPRDLLRDVLAAGPLVHELEVDRPEPLDPTDVIALLPVAVEAKLEPGRLRVRIWPDPIAAPSFDPRLTAREIELRRSYLAADGAATTPEARRAAWQALAERVGPTRAAWIAQAPPDAAVADEQSPFVPRAALLPDRFTVVGEVGGQRVFLVTGAAIPRDLTVGIDDSPEAVAQAANAEGAPIQLPPTMRWMTDFSAAVQVGMALEIPLGPTVDHLDRLVVFGTRAGRAAGAAAVERALTGHRFTRGLAFVPQDTPTNHTADGGSGLPSRAEKVEAGFALERGPRPPLAAATNGAALAEALGIPAAALERTPGADGSEPAEGAAMRTALHAVTLGPLVEDLLGVADPAAKRVRAHFVSSVSAAGPIPAIRVGRQPYGVLPALVLDRYAPEAEEASEARLIDVLQAARIAWRMRRLSPEFAGTAAQALAVPARSTAVFAETVRTDGSGGANAFATLAGRLAIASRNRIRGWRNETIDALVDGAPVPLDRPLVDDATAADLASLAQQRGDAILAGPLPTSLLARMVRHALLLEWSRYARSAIVGQLEAATAATLTRRVTTSDGWIRELTAWVDGPDRADPPRESSFVRLGRAVPVLGRVFGAPAEAPPTRDALARVRADLTALRADDGRLAAVQAAVQRLAALPARRLEALLLETLDLATYRVDAWITSIAARRLATVRRRRASGVVVGAWGYLGDVQRVDPAASRAEYVHAPSLDHAAAAAVLRSAAARAGAAGSSHADVDLSSRRVRAARWLVAGLNEGRSLSEALGQRIERGLKGTAAEPHLGALRRTFVTAGRPALDGLALEFHRPWDAAGAPRHPELPARGSAAGQALDAALAEARAALDALTDALTAEAVYELVRGNGGAALADLDAIASGEGAPPPRLAVTETPSGGTALTHRVLALLPEGSTAPGWPAGTTPRGRVDPLVDAWCGLVLGPADRIVLTVEGARGVAVPLSALGLGALDVVWADPADLEDRLKLAAGAEIGAGVRPDPSWTDLVGHCAALRELLAQAAPISDATLQLAAPLASGPPDDAPLAARADEAFAAMTRARVQLRARTDPAAAVHAAALLGMRVPGALLAPTEEALAALEALAFTRLEASAEAIGAQARLAALFGHPVPGVVPVVAPEPLVAPPGLHGDELASVAAAGWLDAIGRVRPRADRLGEVLRWQEIREGPSDDLTVLQVPFAAGDRWIATAFTNAQTGAAPAGRLSLLVHAPLGLGAGKVGGLLVDAWSERVPAQARDTGIALRFNAPNTRPPQVVLLAVCPNLAEGWSVDLVAQTIVETIELARLRMDPPTAITGSGQRPIVWLGQQPEGTSFTP